MGKSPHTVIQISMFPHREGLIFICENHAFYERWRSENNMKLSDKHSKDGETLERFYNRINLDERRRKMLDDSKEENHVS